MKKIKLFFFSVLTILSLTVSGQVPEAIKYQAVARDGTTGTVLNSQSVNLDFIIYEGPVSPINVAYSESHSLMTNQYGLFSVNISEGTPVFGSFSNIDWSTGEHHMRVDVNGSILGTVQLLSVPYAFYASYADSAGNAGTGATQLNELTDVNTGSAINGQVLQWNGTEWIAATVSTGGGGDDWGSQVVEIDTNLLKGSGLDTDPLSIKGSSDAYRVLRTNSFGNASWSSFGAYRINRSGGISNAPTSWTTVDINPSQFGHLCTGSCGALIKFYSPNDTRILYFTYPSDPNPVEKVYDLPAGRSVVVYVELWNGEYEYYSNVGGQLDWEYIAFFR
jgi:hypothetical protein